MGEEGLVNIPLSVQSDTCEQGKEIDFDEKHPDMGGAAARVPPENKDSPAEEDNYYNSNSPTQDSGGKIINHAENDEDSGDDRIDSDEQSQKILCPPSPLPQPAPPPGLVTARPAAPEEFHLCDLKVIVRPKEEVDDKDVPIDGHDRREIKGRIAFFSRSSCRDCGAVRSFLREKSVPYIEINIDVFPSREKELIQRTGSAAVPKIFVNEKLLGGLEALNALRNSGEFDRTVREMARERCPETAPRAPIYGLDDEDVLAGKERTDEMAEIVRVLRQKVATRDRLFKMTFVKKCYAGSDLVEAIIHHLDCGRKKVSDLGNLINMYAQWHARLIPYYSFDQFVHKAEQVGATKRVRRCIAELRDRVAKGGDPTKLHEPPVEQVPPECEVEDTAIGDQIADTIDPALESHDADDIQDDMFNEIYEKATEEPHHTLQQEPSQSLPGIAPSEANPELRSLEEPPNQAAVNTVAAPSKIQITEEHRARMEANRLKALERAAACAHLSQAS